MKRAVHLAELMDDPDADSQRLQNTYQQFARVNRWLSGWPRIYRQILRPALQTADSARILDIGAGGGDVLIDLLARAAQDQLPITAVAIDPDPRAGEFYRAQRTHPDITYEVADDRQLAGQDREFDVVISNHLLHHLDPEAIRALCRNAQHLTTRLVLFNDIHRSKLAYLLFRGLIPLVFRRSFVWEDGSRSIRRAYTVAELRDIVPDGWTVTRMHPFRLLVRYER